MSDVVLVAIVAAGPAMLTALAGLIVSLKNGHKADVLVAQTETIAAKADAAAVQQQTLASAASRKQQAIADAAAVKQQEIHLLVNSNLSKVKADLAEAIAEIAALHGLLRDLTAAHHAAGKE